MPMILVLTMKDLRRRLADPWAVLTAMMIPIVIAGMMILAFGRRSRGAEADTPKLRIIVVDLNEGPMAGIISGASRNPEAAKRLDLSQAPTREEGLRRLRDEDYAAMLVIPKGFIESFLDSKPVEIELIKNPSQQIMPVVAEQGAEVVALYLSAAARLLGEDAARLRRLVDGEGWDDTIGIAAMIADLYIRVRNADDIIFPPIVEFENRKAGAAAGAPGGFDFVSWMFPGMIVMGLLFAGTTQMKDLLREREARTLRRQLTAPVGAGTIIAAKVLSGAIVVGACHLVLLAAGAFGFGIDWGPPLPLLAASILLVLTATGFGALLYCIVRTERQGDAFSGILIMVMSLLGGTMIPAQVLPAPMRKVAVFTVNHWAQETFRSLAAGRGFEAIGTNLAVLAAMALLFTATGAAVMRRRHLAGGA